MGRFDNAGTDELMMRLTDLHRKKVLSKNAVAEKKNTYEGNEVWKTRLKPTKGIVYLHK